MASLSGRCPVRRAIVIVGLLLVLAGSVAFAQSPLTELRSMSVPSWSVGDEPGSGRTGGIRYDDSTFETAHGWNDTVTHGSFVMAFDLPSSPAQIDAVSTCWARDGSDSSLTYSLALWAADGPNGAPGTLLRRVTGLVADGVGSTPTFYRAAFADLDVSTNKVYVGPEWDSSIDQSFHLCFDENGPGGKPAYAGLGPSAPSVRLGVPINGILPSYKALGVRLEADVGDGGPTVPPGPWLATSALPGYRFKGLISGDRAATQVSDCVPETLCIAGAIPTRTEVFVRIIGPRSNGFLWPEVVRFTVAQVELWIEQLSSGQVNYYKLDGVSQDSDVLNGLVDREGFLPGTTADALRAPWGGTGYDSSGGGAAFAGFSPTALAVRSAVAIAEAEMTGDRDAPPASLEAAVGSGPPVPPGAWLTTSALPGYQFKGLISGNRAATQVADCVPETLCIAGAIPTRTEVFVRIIGPRSNGFLWPEVVRFTVAQVELWIQQLSSGKVSYYKLDGVSQDSDVLNGLVDREGFSPPTPGCTFVVSQPIRNWSWCGGDASYTVTKPTACVFSAVSDVSWIHPLPFPLALPNSDVGSFVVDANHTGSPRQGMITIAGQSFTIHQPARSDSGQYDGMWSGTTNTNRAVSACVANNVLQMLRVTVSMNFVTFTCTTPLVRNTPLAISGNGYNGKIATYPELSNISTTVNGSFNSSASMSASWSSFSDFYYIFCGSSVSFGEGTTLSAGSFTATKQ